MRSVCSSYPWQTPQVRKWCNQLIMNDDISFGFSRERIIYRILFPCSLFSLIASYSSLPLLYISQFFSFLFCEFLSRVTSSLLLILLLFNDYTYTYFSRDSGFLNHVQLVHQFRCSLPQPRAVPVEDLLNIGPGPDEIFYPPSTVLARCAGSGCCPDYRQICAPIETRNVSLVFMIKHRIDQQRDRHHEIIHALEHTKCACIDEILAAKNATLWTWISILQVINL